MCSLWCNDINYYKIVLVEIRTAYLCIHSFVTRHHIQIINEESQQRGIAILFSDSQREGQESSLTAMDYTLNYTYQKPNEIWTTVLSEKYGYVQKFPD
jgi:hypothetical protein